MPDLVVFLVDAPIGPNHGRFCMGTDLDANGAVTDGWTGWMDVPDWGSWSNQGLAIALADLDNSGSLDLIVFTIDNPVGANEGRFRRAFRVESPSQ